MLIKTGFIFFASFSILAFSIQFSNAQEAKIESLDSLIKDALENNPQILASKKRFEARQAMIPQASSLNDPILEFGYDNMLPRMTGMEPPMRTYGISQEVPFPTKLFLKREIASKDAKIAYENFKEKEKTVIQEIKSLYAELFLIYRSIEIDEENEALLGQVAASAARRYSLGQGSQQDALKAQVELAKIKNDLIMLEQKRQITEAKLNIILNRDIEQELGKPQLKPRKKLNQSIEELYKLTKENRPELFGFRHVVDRQRSVYSLSKQEYLPDIMVKYERQVIHGDTGPWKGMLGLSFPFWFWEKQNYNVKQMRAELEMAKAEYNGMENVILLEVKDAYTRIVATNKLADIYETSFVPQAEQAFKSSLISYEANNTDFLNLLDSQRMLLEIKLDHYRTLVDLEIAEADLERAVGKDIFDK